MLQKRRFKVLAALPRTDGQGEWFMRIGNGFENKDGSINVYLDVIPVSGNGSGKGLKLQIRELDENDLRQREAHRANASASGSGPDTNASAPGALEGTPF